MAVLDDVAVFGWTLDRDWNSDATWRERLRQDRIRAERYLTPKQTEITEILIKRAHNLGVLAIALTGSTARGKRTTRSDLDFHLVGRRPEYTDLAEELDVYATDLGGFWQKLRGGDDYVQWTLRYGCVLFDQGVFREAMKELARDQIWPSSSGKLVRMPQHLRLARQLVQMGDEDAAQDQVRATLTSLARAILLDAQVFPLARAELPTQLASIGFEQLAWFLERNIFEELGLEQLDEALAVAESCLPEMG